MQTLGTIALTALATVLLLALLGAISSRRGRRATPAPRPDPTPQPEPEQVPGGAGRDVFVARLAVALVSESNEDLIRCARDPMLGDVEAMTDGYGALLEAAIIALRRERAAQADDNSDEHRIALEQNTRAEFGLQMTVDTDMTT